MVCGFFCDSILSEMHIMSNLIFSSLKKLFRLSIWADNEVTLRCKTDKSSCFTLILFSSYGVLILFSSYEKEELGQFNYNFRQKLYNVVIMLTEKVFPKGQLRL